MSSQSEGMPTVSAIVLAYGEEPWLEQCIGALLASEGVSLDVVLVDNGTSNPAVEQLAVLDGVRMVRPAQNLGFTGGCNAGVAEASGDVVLLVNSDAIVEPAAAGRLARAARDPRVGIATASLRLADRAELLNSAGNPVHLSGITWSGCFEEPADLHRQDRDVASASGAAMAIRRSLWLEMGGLCEQYFAYLEDTEFSVRVWQRGLAVRFVADAVVRHYYEFSRNELKWYLLERNRLVMVLTTYERATLVALAPLLMAVELMVVALAAKQGWLSAKVRGWRWLISHREWIRERRAQLQRERLRPDVEVTGMLESRLAPGNMETPALLRPLNTAFVVYWSILRRLLGAAQRASS